MFKSLSLEPVYGAMRWVAVSLCLTAAAACIAMAIWGA